MAKKETMKNPIQKTVKAEPVQAPVKAEAKTSEKWSAGKYLMLKTYFGKWGKFKAGNEYELTKEQAEAFGNVGEIKCL